jgi:hypothetical protein
MDGTCRAGPPRLAPEEDEAVGDLAHELEAVEGSGMVGVDGGVQQRAHQHGRPFGVGAAIAL